MSAPIGPPVEPGAPGRGSTRSPWLFPVLISALILAVALVFLLQQDSDGVASGGSTAGNGITGGEPVGPLDPVQPDAEPVPGLAAAEARLQAYASAQESSEDGQLAGAIEYYCARKATSAAEWDYEAARNLYESIPTRGSSPTLPMTFEEAVEQYCAG